MTLLQYSGGTSAQPNSYSAGTRSSSGACHSRIRSNGANTNKKKWVRSTQQQQQPVEERSPSLVARVGKRERASTDYRYIAAGRNSLRISRGNNDDYCSEGSTVPAATATHKASMIPVAAAPASHEKSAFPVLKYSNTALVVRSKLTSGSTMDVASTTRSHKRPLDQTSSTEEHCRSTVPEPTSAFQKIASDKIVQTRANDHGSIGNPTVTPATWLRVGTTKKAAPNTFVRQFPQQQQLPLEDTASCSTIQSTSAAAPLVHHPPKNSETISGGGSTAVLKYSNGAAEAAFATIPSLPYRPQRRPRDSVNAPKRIRLSAPRQEDDDTANERVVRTGRTNVALQQQQGKPVTTTIAEKLTDFAYRSTAHGGGGGGGGARVQRRRTTAPPRQSRGLVRVHPDERTTRICPTYLRGVACTQISCTLRHDVPPHHATPVCQFFQRQGMCRNNDHCRFRHVKISARAVMCPSFARRGFCRNEQCAMMHSSYKNVTTVSSTTTGCGETEKAQK
jgi:hypothetical protein